MGELSLDSLDKDAQMGEHVLSNISVISAYRLCWIATALINFANITNSSQNGTRLVVFGGQSYNSRYRLTFDGMKLIQSCLNKGILDSDQFLGNESLASPEHSSA